MLHTRRNRQISGYYRGGRAFYTSFMLLFRNMLELTYFRIIVIICIVFQTASTFDQNVVALRSTLHNHRIKEKIFCSGAPPITAKLHLILLLYNFPYINRMLKCQIVCGATSVEKSYIQDYTDNKISTTSPRHSDADQISTSAKLWFSNAGGKTRF